MALSDYAAASCAYEEIVQCSLLAVPFCAQPR
jgi:hypothetical protein